MTPEQVNGFYRTIKNRELPDSMIDIRVNIVRALEGETKQVFGSTREFHENMDGWIAGASISRGEEKGV